jgi:ketosteroid isomerase-like protein
MKKILLGLLFCTVFANAQNNETTKINQTLDAWHLAAAEANFDAYFNLMTEYAVFVGTDATENWNKTAFKAYAKPHFDKGKAWNFKALERHVYLDQTGKTAWFDELLDTQMKICRGSGVLVKIGKDWKIKHYVLSMTVPNEDSNEVIKIKAAVEERLINKLLKRE